MKILLFSVLWVPILSMAMEFETATPQLEFLPNLRGPGMDLRITTTTVNPTNEVQRAAICARYFDAHNHTVSHTLGRFESIEPREHTRLILDDLRKDAAFFEDLDAVDVSVVTDRSACSGASLAPRSSANSLPLNLELYIDALSAVDIVEPFGQLVWGETPGQVITRICEQGLFTNMQERSAFCASTSEQLTFRAFAEGQLDSMTAQAMVFHLDFLANYHRGVRLYQENIQLIASDPVPLVIAPIQLFGVPYELHLDFEGLDQYLALWHLEQTINPFCFTSESQSFCEYPTVLTRVTLRSNDPRRTEVCANIQAALDQRYGTERPVIRSGSRLNASSSDCGTLEYLASHYLQELHTPPLRTLQRAQVTQSPSDDAGGL